MVLRLALMFLLMLLPELGLDLGYQAQAPLVLLCMAVVLLPRCLRGMSHGRKVGRQQRGCAAHRGLGMLLWCCSRQLWWWWW